MTAWDDLFARALEPNPFLAAPFALAAARHLVGADRAGAPRLLVAGRGGRLLGLLVVALPRLHPAGRVARGWAHPFAPLGAPLLDAAEAGPALDALLAALRGAGRGALLLADLPAGPVAALLAARGALPVAGRRRVVLAAPAAGGAAEGPAGRALPARRRKELERQARRLAAEHGPLALDVAAAPGAVAAALEGFLALEALGWKGAGGTALRDEPGRAAFAREAVAGLAARGLARVVTLRAGARPVAAGVVLRGGGRAVFWKIAHDPALGARSPGAQLALALGPAALAEPGVALVDSLAGEDHPMIARLWPGREAVADLAVPLGPQGPLGPARRAAAAERARLALRAALRALRDRLRGRAARRRGAEASET